MDFMALMEKKNKNEEEQVDIKEKSRVYNIKESKKGKSPIWPAILGPSIWEAQPPRDQLNIISQPMSEPNVFNPFNFVILTPFSKNKCIIVLQKYFFYVISSFKNQITI